MPAERTSLSKMKIVVAVIAMTVLMLGLMLVIQGMIEQRDYRGAILKAIKAETGEDATIKGRVSVWLLPLPTIYVPDVDLAGADETAPAIHADMVKLSVPVDALFSKQLRISSLQIDTWKMSVTRSSDHRMQWKWLNTDLVKKLLGSTAEPISVSLKDGTITWHNEASDNTIVATNVNAIITLGKSLTVDSDFALAGHVLRADLQARPEKGAAIPLVLDFFADGKHAINWKGTADLSGQALKLEGKLAFSIDDTLSLFETQSSDNPLSRLPLAVSGDWAENGSDVTLTGMQIKGLNSEGEGKATLTWKDHQPSFAVDTHFKTFDFDQWETLLSALFLPPPSASYVYSGNGNNTPNPLPSNAGITLHLAADTLAVGSEQWKNAALDADLSDASATINKFNVTLPGDASFSLLGIVSPGATGGLRFDGNVTSDGKSLKSTLAAFTDSAAALPEAGFGAFHLDSNLFISAEQLRLSEADVKLGNLHLNGGMVDYFDAKRPRIEADLQLKDINFDYFRDVWRARQQKKAGAKVEDVLSIDRSKSFNWLKGLQTTIDFKVAVDGFTFLDRKGSIATFRLFAKEGDVGLYDIRLHYPDNTTEASLDLNVNGDQPQVSVVLNTKALDLDYFNPQPEPTPTATQKAVPPAPAMPLDKRVWSKALIDMGWMEGWGGKLDLSVDEITDGQLTLKNFKIQSVLNNDLMTLQRCSFQHWQGQWGVAGVVYGGAVPGVALSFTLFNGELHDILQALVGRDNISGHLSVSGTVSTSGVNELSWVSQADSKLVMAARGVMVGGINLKGVVHAVSVSRTAADVLNNVNRELVDGNTLFDVDGNINVKDGVMGTPGMTLKSGTVIGDLTGSIKLVPWTMDLTTLFQFPAITSDTVPTMTLKLTGPINAAALKTDTSSLEAYVVRHITQQQPQ